MTHSNKHSKLQSSNDWKLDVATQAIAIGSLPGGRLAWQRCWAVVAQLAEVVGMGSPEVVAKDSVCRVTT